MTLAVEGAATTSFSSTNSTSINITTAGTDRIIVLAVQNEWQGGVTPTISSVTASGLTFYKRKQFYNPDGGDIEVWWAYAAAQLTAKAITIGLSSNTDDACVVVFAVSGVHNFVNPWDPHISLPATAHSIITTPAVVSGVSTTNTNCLIFGFWGNLASGNVGAHSTYTLVGTAHNGGGIHYANIMVEYLAVSSPQSSISVSTKTTDTAGYWVMLADAITDAAAAPTWDHNAVMVNSN